MINICMLKLYDKYVCKPFNIIFKYDGRGFPIRMEKSKGPTISLKEQHSVC